MANELQPFVKEALSKGLARTDIQLALRHAHWQDDEIDAALDEYMVSDFPIPVPKRKPYLSAREAFLYLVLFLTLYMSAISYGSLLFAFVNRSFPDVLNGYISSFDASLSTVRNATASLIITFPLFLFVSWFLRRTMQRHPEKRGSKVRKWLTYITLFIAAGVIIGDLITLVNYLLSGGLTTRILLKVVIVLVIAGTIFGHYLWDLRKEEHESQD